MSPRLVVTVGPGILGDLVSKMQHCCMPTKSCTLLDAEVQGISELKPMDNNRVGDFHQQVRGGDSRKVVGIKC